MKAGDHDDHPRNLPLLPNSQCQQQPHDHRQQRQPQALLHQMALNQKRECKSDDVDVTSSGAGEEPRSPHVLLPTPSDTKKQKKAGDDSIVGVTRRPRGRPPGSKNRPKKPVVPATPPDSSHDDGMRSHILEVPAGHDVAESLARFARLRDVGLSVLSGTGPVSNITFRRQASSGVSTFTFPGRFEILSVSASFLPPSFVALSGMVSSPGGVSVSVAGPQGRIVGGLISGPLVAAGTVIIVAATFSNPDFQRLPMEGDELASTSAERSRSREIETQHLRLPAGNVSSSAQAAGGMSIYSSHVPSDVIWAPTARGPPPF